MVLETLLSLWIGAVALVASFLPFLLIGVVGFTAWSMYQHRSMQAPAQAVKTKTKTDSSKVLVIDDYKDFINECWKEEEEDQSKSENPQKQRMKAKQKQKRRTRNRIAQRSRRANRKK